MESPQPMENPPETEPPYLMSLAQSLELWSEKYNVPVSPGVIPTTAEDVSLHLAFLGTRIRGLYTLCMARSMAGLEPTAAVEEQMVHDSRVACLILVTACGQLTSEKKEVYMRRLEILLQKHAGQTGTSPETGGVGSSGEVASSPSSESSHASAEDIDCHLGTRGPSHTHTDKTQSSASCPSKALPIDQIIAEFPAVATSVLARRITGEPGSITLGGSEEGEDSDADDRRQQKIIDRELHRQDIDLLNELGCCLSVRDRQTDDDQSPRHTGSTSRVAAHTIVKLGGLVREFSRQGEQQSTCRCR